MYVHTFIIQYNISVTYTIITNITMTSHYKITGHVIIGRCGITVHSKDLYHNNLKTINKTESIQNVPV